MNVLEDEIAAAIRIYRRSLESLDEDFDPDVSPAQRPRIENLPESRRDSLPLGFYRGHPWWTNEELQALIDHYNPESQYL